MQNVRPRWAPSVLALLIATSCGGIAVRDGQGSAGASGALSGAAGASGGLAGMSGGGQAAIGGSAPGVTGGANFAGQGGSGGAPADHCAGPLRVADPDVEQSLRELIGKATEALYTSDFAGVSELRLILPGSGVKLHCSDAVDCVLPDPPAEDGAVTSLVGLECLPHLQQLELDAWFVKDFSPLISLSELTTLKVFLSKGAQLPPLPQLRELRVYNSDGDLSSLLALSTLTSFRGHYQDLSAKDALGPLRSLPELRTLIVTNSKLNDLNGLQALSKLTTIDLSNNEISDLSPLAQNMGFGFGTTIDVRENPISCDDPSVTALRERQVSVEPCGF